jgi:hypothetical protein
MSDNFRGDEYGTEEDFQQLTGQASPGTGSNTAPAPSTTDPVIDFEGQKIPLSQIKQWQASHTNQSKWQAENTKKSQEFAAQKKAWETKYPDYEKKVKEWEAYNNFLAQNPQAYQEVQQAITKYAAASKAQGPQPQGRDPAYEQLQKELADMKTWRTSLEQRQQQDQLAKETEAAYAELAKNDPDFKKEDFDTFLQEASTKADTVSGLYSLIHQAWKAKSAPDIRKAAEKATLQKIKNKQTSATETGKGGSTAGLPQNKDVSGNWNDIFSKEMEERGLFKE